MGLLHFILSHWVSYLNLALVSMIFMRLYGEQSNFLSQTFLPLKDSSESKTNLHESYPITPLSACSTCENGSPFTLVQSHSGDTFFEGWNFFTYPDPTHGSVQFVSQAEAKILGLSYTDPSGSSVMKVDSNQAFYNVDEQEVKRKSVRIESKIPIKVGSLVIADLDKIPFGPGVWPAFWTVGQNWPWGGEIDIVEGVHYNTQNQYTLHTAPGCMLTTPMEAYGVVLNTNCDASINYNSGCGARDPSDESFGANWNNVGGGVYALLLEESGVSIWMFKRDQIPADIQAGRPAFQSWGMPRFKADKEECDIWTYFGPQTMVFDITLCGDWAGNTYDEAIGGSCIDAVREPGNYRDAVFQVKSVKVYEYS